VPTTRLLSVSEFPRCSGFICSITRLGSRKVRWLPLSFSPFPFLVCLIPSCTVSKLPFSFEDPKSETSQEKSTAGRRFPAPFPPPPYPLTHAAGRFAESFFTVNRAQKPGFFAWSLLGDPRPFFFPFLTRDPPPSHPLAPLFLTGGGIIIRPSEMF